MISNRQTDRNKGGQLRILKIWCYDLALRVSGMIRGLRIWLSMTSTDQSGSLVPPNYGLLNSRCQIHRPRAISLSPCEVFPQSIERGEYLLNNSPPIYWKYPVRNFLKRQIIAGTGWWYNPNGLKYCVLWLEISLKNGGFFFIKRRRSFFL